MSIPFTQFHLPNGQRTLQQVDRPEIIELIAHGLIARGVRFEIEILRTGEVSMEAVIGDDTTLAIDIVKNGPDVPLAVDRLIQTADKAMMTI